MTRARSYVYTQNKQTVYNLIPQPLLTCMPVESFQVVNVWESRPFCRKTPTSAKINRSVNIRLRFDWCPPSEVWPVQRRKSRWWPGNILRFLFLFIYLFFDLFYLLWGGGVCRREAVIELLSTSGLRFQSFPLLYASMQGRLNRNYSTWNNCTNIMSSC